MAKNTDSRLKRKELKKFGFSFGLGMGILTSVGLFKSFHLAVMLTSSSLFIFHILGAFISPVILTPTFKIISFVGKTIVSIVTTVFFTFFYYIIFTPFSVFSRITGKDVIGKQLQSKGWIDIPQKDNSSSRIKKQY